MKCNRPPLIAGFISLRERLQRGLPRCKTSFVAAGLLFAAASTGRCQDESAVSLPNAVKAVWALGAAQRDTTPTRERISINGLWRWQPAEADSNRVPSRDWGYFKVPGPWPGITDYMQKDSQTVFAHRNWKDARLGSLSAAWYEREISIPQEWAGRRIALAIEYLNSFAAVFVDGEERGELHFPGGELDLTPYVRRGSKHRLSLLVVAMPLKGVLQSYTDSNAAREVQGRVARRGLCGDVHLVSTLPGSRIGDVKVNTSVRQWKIQFGAALNGIASNQSFSLRARVATNGRQVQEFTSRSFKGDELDSGRFALAENWKPDELWDLHTPQNLFDVQLALLDSDGRVLDEAFPVRFGFREFWIDGRDFYLNGTRIWLCAVPLDNAQVGTGLANYGSARESLERFKNIGINFVYTHNYGCEPGSHLSFEEILRAADDVGMLVSLSQPHFSHYDWKMSGAEQANGYARHAEFYTRAAGSHASVVAYGMSHNATGYSEDMNPDMIDGVQNPRDSWSRNNARLALRAEAIVKRLDPHRIVYHHASGNLGSMHLSNFYPNFAPIQELSDWFEHWATHGVKPMFTCEYGAPFTWDWTMYRGWYKGEREFGSATVPWEFCLAEWNAQFLGDHAFDISENEAANLRWEAKQMRAGRVWHRWDYPNAVGSTVFDERFPIFARYLDDNWPAFRTWGVSAISPWQYGHFWKLRKGVNKRRREFIVDWENLQRPGFSPDFSDRRYERMDLAFERDDWIATGAAQALVRHNQPLLACIAGKPDSFTSKDHLFVPGESVEKQIVVINNSRQPVTCEAQWSFGLPKTETGAIKFALPTGEQKRVPLRFTLPEALAPGDYVLGARVRFSSGETQSDSFSVRVLPRPQAVQVDGRFALFDPNGETKTLLEQMGVRCQLVDAAADLSGYDTLIVGKSALTVSGEAPDIGRVRDGLKVLLFEQAPEVLERRFGFRVAEYGLRRVFPRVPDHPILAGLTLDDLCDWRGKATILPQRLSYELRPRYGPTVKWCDIPVPRLWRAGNRGNVASVLIEKPVRGDFLPIIDGGYSLQYSPLLEHHEGRGMVLFCQLDVTGRTEADPAAATMAGNILRYVSEWKPTPTRKAVYAGDPAGRRHLESAGIVMGSATDERLTADQVLVLGPGGGRELKAHKTAISEWLNAGGNLLAVGIDQEDADAVLPFQISLTSAEHISAFFEPNAFGSLLAGVGSADVHNRDPREIPLMVSGATVIGNGVLTTATDANVVFSQLAPWQFDPNKQSNLKRTFRRVSFTVTRLLANLGVSSASPILERFHRPVNPAQEEKRWLDGLYLDQPEEWDDPYRFFRW